jgi:FkbM family methyltransferase
LRANERRKISFYDVGANIGHHSLFMSPLVDDVFAFEPFHDLIKLIEDKIELNRLANVRILPFALGEHDSRMDYFPGLGANPGAGSLIQGFPGVSRESVPVEIRNGDDLLDNDNLPRIDLLKLDVQGFEPNVLRGLARRIRSDRPIVLAEMTDESRSGFGTASDFQKTFYEDALFAEVTGRNGRSYRLEPFEYASSAEVLVLPPELAGFLNGKL